MITLVELKNKILLIEDDLHSLAEFITPQTDLHMLYLLKLACSEGLNIEDVDKGRFLEANTNDLKLQKEENQSDKTDFINISLDHILKEGKKYTYRDFFDVFGLNSQINAELMIEDVKSELGKDLNIAFESPSDKLFDLNLNNLRTLEELLNHLNSDQKKRKIIFKNPWWKFWLLEKSY